MANFVNVLKYFYSKNEKNYEPCLTNLFQMFPAVEPPLPWGPLSVDTRYS